jgi:hypothetical protein
MANSDRIARIVLTVVAAAAFTVGASAATTAPSVQKPAPQTKKVAPPIPKGAACPEPCMPHAPSPLKGR